VAAHRQPQQPEAEPSGPLEIVDVVLRLNSLDPDTFKYVITAKEISA
jgi:hypothetical protein